MVIMDATGRKVAMLQKYLLAVRATYVVYSYEPNTPGMEAKERDDEGVPVYRFADIQKAVFTMTDEVHEAQLCSMRPHCCRDRVLTTCRARGQCGSRPSRRLF